VLGDHPDQEVIPRKLREPLENLLAHLGHIGARVVWGENWKRPSLGALVRERVIEIVELAASAVAVAEQPELLEVADVRQIPDERRLERRDLARQLLVVERLEQGLGSRARVLENRLELSR
jgi:hypothetical protein